MSELLDDLIANIEQERGRALRAEITPGGRTQPIASDIDPDSCLRRQVFELTESARKLPITPELKARFDVGILWERRILADLHNLGFDVVEGQTRFELKGRSGRVVLSGKIDGKLAWPPRSSTDPAGRVLARVKFPFEIKSMHPSIFGRYRTAADLMESPFHRRYVYQLQAYMLGHGVDEGLFIITNCLGAWRLVPVKLDLDLAEQLLGFAERILEAAEAYRFIKDAGNIEGTAWSKATGFAADTDECSRCGFLGTVCEPPWLSAPAPETLELPSLREAVDVWRRTKDAAAEHARAEKEIKEKAKAAGVAVVTCDDVVVSVKEVSKKGYSVPAKTERHASIKVLREASDDDE